MATTKETYMRWLAYNLNGAGKNTGTCSSHFYCDDVYYYNGVPQQRIFKRPGKTPVVVAIAGLFQPKLRQGCDTIFVEDIAVFSKYPGDKLDGQAAHDRQRYMMLNRVLYHVDVEIPGYQDEVCTRPTMIDRELKHIDQWVGNYNEYSRMFGLDWPELSDEYRSRAELQLRRKAKRWVDPDAIKQRERAKAKRLANKALGLV